MTTENALDPPRAGLRTGRAPRRRTAARVAGVVIALAVIAVILVFTLGRHPDQANEATRARFERGGGSSQQITPPPAVTPQNAAETRANLAAAQRAADSPALAASHVQVAAVSPPGGPAPRGAGVSASSSSLGPADG